jgi:hypothetical protein
VAALASESAQPEPIFRPLSLRRIGGFVRAHLAYAMLAPLLMFAGTVVHELAHAGAVLGCGGEVINIDLLPELTSTSISFGSIHWRGPIENPDFVTMAPAAVWTLIAASSLLWIGRLRRPIIAKSAFAFLFLLPLVDIALHLGSLYADVAGSDYHKVLADHKTATALVALGYFATALWMGWRRLFQPIFGASLSGLEYTLGMLLLLATTPVAIALLT